MKAANFNYDAPDSLEEVLGLLASHGEDAKVLAGGQSLVPMLALRLARFERLVDLNGVAELEGIDDAGASLRIGAMTRQAVAGTSAVVEEAVPLLARAIPHIGHFQIRNRGTIGGSLAHADPASELPAVACSLDAEFELARSGATRRLAAEEFFVSMWETAIGPEEVLVAVHVPKKTARSGFAIEELNWRSGDFAIAGVAAAVSLDAHGVVDRARLTLMGMGSTPVRARTAEAALVGVPATSLDLDGVANAAIEDADPSDDVHASADYRRRAGRTLVAWAVRRAVAEAGRA